jgi:hypothetical protein
VVGPDPHHQHFVEPKRADLADAFGVGIEEGFAVSDDRIVDAVPDAPMTVKAPFGR